MITSGSADGYGIEHDDYRRWFVDQHLVGGALVAACGDLAVAQFLLNAALSSLEALESPKPASQHH